MKTIQIEELRNWLIDYITNAIQSMKSENSKEFDKWAKSFKKEEAEFVVDAEFVNDWGYTNCDSVSEEDAIHYANSLIQRIVNCWYI